MTLKKSHIKAIKRSAWIPFSNGNGIKNKQHPCSTLHSSILTFYLHGVSS